MYPQIVADRKQQNKLNFLQFSFPYVERKSQNGTQETRFSVKSTQALLKICIEFE